MRSIILGLIKLYSLMISPLLGRNCRFHPSCSAYSYNAVQTHGVIKGLWLSARRIVRCQPFYNGPINDPVPPLPAVRKDKA